MHSLLRQEVHVATVCPTEMYCSGPFSDTVRNLTIVQGSHLLKNQFKGVKKKETIHSGKHHSALFCDSQ